MRLSVFPEDLKSTSQQKHIVFDSEGESETEIPASAEEGPGGKLLGKVSGQ